MFSFGIFKFSRPRFYGTWFFALFLAIFGKTSNLGFWIGIPIIIIGEIFRIWSQGSIQKRTRLSDSGPYAYTRNPLYFSNFLIGLGFIVFFSNPLIVAIYLAGFSVIYNDAIKKEEKFLSETYGNAYQNYCAHVPRFFPGIPPYVNRSNHPFEWKLVWQHGEPITFLAITLLAVGVSLRQEWYQNGQGFLSSYAGLFYIAIVTAILLLVLVVQRKFKRH